MGTHHYHQSANNFHDTIVRYGGYSYPNSPYALLYVSNASPTIQNNTFAYAHTYGIYVSGSSSNPTISSNTISNATYGVYVIGASAAVSGNTFSNNSYGLTVDDSTVSITNNTFSSNTVPVLQQDTAFPTYSGNTFSNNSYQAIGVAGTLSSGSGTWSDIQGLGLPYLVTNDVIIASTFTLSIDPGIVVKFRLSQNNFTVRVFLNSSHMIVAERAGVIGIGLE